MKNHLWWKTIPTTGRIRLGKFYNASSKEKGWNFGESAAWLRDVGALDETDPEDPKVLLPNYMTSSANCVATSDYYAICCPNECEDAMHVFEEEIEAPYASPERILEIWKSDAELKSMLKDNDLNVKDKNIDKHLHSEKLAEIAASNGGVVPIHGRLFAQYLHHVAPVHCPFPHSPGALAKSGIFRYEANSDATAEEIKKYEKIADRLEADKEALKKKRKGNAITRPEIKGFWNKEEHLYTHKVRKSSAGMRTIMLFGAIGFFGLAVLKLATDGRPSQKEVKLY
eukprot:TRINITY_DN3750_c0_g1_i5.p1 TRINITY_DN3750_c0_g1~~TRINITY_DN3750_c0_g1_i5.p1  ORF type:complete len:284 (-),score=65.36 TRINITY_DN3750_c0_g1_i5:274-1125(-)